MRYTIEELKAMEEDANNRGDRPMAMLMAVMVHAREHQYDFEVAKQAQWVQDSMTYGDRYEKWLNTAGAS